MVERAGNLVGDSRLRTSRRRRGRGSRSALEDSAAGRTEKWPGLRILLLAAMALVLIAAPLPMGANRIWAWTVLESLVFGLLLVWCLACPRNDDLLPLKSTDLLVLAGGVWLLYLAFYLVPLPAFIVKAVSPQIYSDYARMYDIVGQPEPRAYLTLDRYLSLQALLKQAMYLSGFMLVVALATSRARLRLVLFVLLGAGVIEVLIGMAANAFNVDLVPRKLLDGHWNILRGTFVNRNHFAAFLAMSAAAGLGLSLSYLRRSPPAATIRVRIGVLVEQLSGPVLFVGVGVVLVGAGMILSTSRGGVGALVCATVLVMLLALIARGWKSRELVLVWPLAGVLAAGAFWVGSRQLIDRISSGGLVIQERWIQWEATKQLIGDFWLTGVGPGLYSYAFTAYKDDRFRPLIYDHAHNDYLELLSEQGITGAVLVTVLVLVIYQRLIRAFVKRSDIVVRGALFASLTGMTAMLIHSLVEFNFQIPANALYFWVLAGTGVAATRLESRERDPYGYGHRSAIRTSAR